MGELRRRERVRAATMGRAARISQRVAAPLFAVVVSLLAAPPAAARAPQLIDRIVAVVNGEVITLGQLNRAVRLAQDDPSDETALCTVAGNDAVEAQVLECMIDDLLMFQHVRRFPQFDVLPEDIDAAYQQRVELFESHQAFEEDLRRQQKTPAEVRYDLERQALIANYIDLRYRDVVDITESEIRRFYEEELRAEMERQGGEMPVFEAVDDELIQPLLAVLEVNRRVEEWIADLRRRADIVTYLW